MYYIMVQRQRAVHPNVIHADTHQLRLRLRLRRWRVRVYKDVSINAPIPVQLLSLKHLVNAFYSLKVEQKER